MNPTLPASILQQLPHPPIAFIEQLGLIGLAVIALVAVGLFYLLLTCYRKVEKEPGAG